VTVAPISVVLVEDHALYRRTLGRAIARDPGLRLLGEAADGIAGLELVRALRPDVAVLDLRLPGLDGLEVCARLARSEPPCPTRVLVLTAFDEPDLAWRVVAHGGAGYLDKQAAHDDVRGALRALARGGVALAGPMLAPWASAAHSAGE